LPYIITALITVTPVANASSATPLNITAIYGDSMIAQWGPYEQTALAFEVRAANCTNLSFPAANPKNYYGRGLLSNLQNFTVYLVDAYRLDTTNYEFRTIRPFAPVFVRTLADARTSSCVTPENLQLQFCTMVNYSTTISSPDGQYEDIFL